MPREKIFSQLEIYSSQIVFWESQLKHQTYKVGEYNQTKDNIKKTYDMIDALLDKYNKEKNLLPCS